MFTFHKKINLYKIKAGNFHEIKDFNCCRYFICSKNNFIEITNLINGKFRRPKLVYLHRAID